MVTDSARLPARAPMAPPVLVPRASAPRHVASRRAEPLRAHPCAARVIIWLALGLAGWTAIASVLLTAGRLIG